MCELDIGYWNLGTLERSWICWAAFLRHPTMLHKRFSYCLELRRNCNPDWFFSIILTSLSRNFVKVHPVQEMRPHWLEGAKIARWPSLLWLIQTSFLFVKIPCLTNVLIYWYHSNTCVITVEESWPSQSTEDHGVILESFYTRGGRAKVLQPQPVASDSALSSFFPVAILAGDN